MNGAQSAFFDWVRVISAQLVILGHILNYNYGYYTSPASLIGGGKLFIQNLGVVFFFVISGCLIGVSLRNKMMSQDTYGFRDFLVDRFSRIYVTFIPCLVIIWGVDLYNYKIFEGYEFSKAFNVETFVANLFMLQDFPTSLGGHLKFTSFGSARPLWTLAVEWWLYMCCGWLFLRFNNNRSTSCLDIFILIAFLVVPVANIIGGRGSGLGIIWFMCFFVGYYSYFFSLKSVSTSILWIGLFVSTFSFFKRTEAAETFYDLHSMLLLAMSLIIALTLLGRMGGNRFHPKLLSAFAGASFSLYLIHYSVLDLYMNNFKFSVLWVDILIPYTLSICMSLSIWWVFDRKHKVLAEKFKRLFKW